MSERWEERPRPNRLEGKYLFPSYGDLRDFLDAAAELSEQQGLYPDMGFGSDYVNITIHMDEGEEELTDRHRQFAEQLDTLFESQTK